MKIRDVARDSYQLATSLEECPLVGFWVVLLDDGTEVYQSEDRADLKEPNAWMRLKLLCKEQGRKVLHMAYAFRNNAGEQMNGLPNADGYFFGRRLRKLMAADPRICGYTDSAIGIGYLRGDILTINWRRNDGVVEEEHRDISKLDSIPFNLIRN